LKQKEEEEEELLKANGSYCSRIAGPARSGRSGNVHPTIRKYNLTGSARFGFKSRIVLFDQPRHQIISKNLIQILR